MHSINAFNSLKKLVFHSIITLALINTIVLYAGNKSTSHTKYTTSYRTIYLTFYHDFPWQEVWKNKASTGCIPVAGPATSKPFNFMQKKMRCREHVVLLRQKSIADSYKIEQKRTGYVNLNFPEFGLINVRAHIDTIKPFALNSTELISRNKNKRLITALLIRHILDVRQYTFKNINKGTFSKINVTPEHLFYTKNRHAFIPIFQISPHDRLITDTYDQVKLVCQRKEYNQCSQPYQPGHIKQVYNLEVSHQHTYFAGDMHLLVHNICNLAKRLQSSINDLITIDKNDKAYLNIRGDRDYRKALYTLHTTQEGYLPALMIALAISQEEQIPIPIRLIENLAQDLSVMRIDSTEIDNYAPILNDFFIYLGPTQRSRPPYGLENIFKLDGSKRAIIRTRYHLAIVRKKPGDKYEFSKFTDKGAVIFSESNEHLLDPSGFSHHNEKLTILSYLNF